MSGRLQLYGRMSGQLQDDTITKVGRKRVLPIEVMEMNLDIRFNILRIDGLFCCEEVACVFTLPYSKQELKFILSGEQRKSNQDN